ncbi:MAG: ATP-binding protein [Saprospiraceae bacterium]
MVVVITGPESSGKTTLAQAISNEFDFCLVPELSRQILNQSNGEYDYGTIDIISKEQWKCQMNTTHQCIQVCCDTDLLTSIIWGKVKYNKYESWWEATWLASQVDCFLLCTPDLEWEFDPLRENPFDRDHLFEIYKRYLEFHDAPYYIIDGMGEERLNKAIHFIQPYLRSNKQ